MGKRKKYIWFYIGFSITLLFGVLFCFAKRIFNVDESLSYALANAPGGWITYEPNGWLQKSLFSNYAVMGTPFDYSQVYFNQMNDVHPPLFYNLLHTISSLFPGRFTIWYGLIINLISYLFNACVLFFWTKKITKDEFLSFLVMLLYALNTTVITDGLLFIRMYQLASSFVLLLTISAYNILTDSEIHYRWYFLLFISIFLGGLTHYYFYIILALTCLACALIMLKNREFNKLFAASIIVLVACGINVILFPPIFKHLFSSTHGQNALNSVSSFNLNIDRFLGYCKNFVLGKAFAFVGIIIASLTMIIGIRDKKKIMCISASFVLIYYIYLTVISQISMHAVNRYILPFDIIYILFIIVCIYELLQKNKIIIYVITIFLILSNLSLEILNDLVTKCSWEYAEENQNKVAVIITEEETPDYSINTLFADLRWYLATGITQLTHKFENDIDKDFILYVQKGISFEESEKYLCRNISGNLQFDLQKDIRTTLFDIYYVSVK
ncbi:hypothetical protein [Holdemania massiliensis]